MTGNTPGNETRPLVVVDAANVVGSKPDGWWRDRRAANERLRDGLSGLGRRGIGDVPPPCDVVLVVEGQARGLDSISGVEVLSAPASGDDQIVELVAQHPERRRMVVTADRELRSRVTALGAEVVGPRAVYP
jgi:hypothetical protein